MSGNIITETWLAYAFDQAVPLDRTRSALARVEAHYGAQLESPPRLHASVGQDHGIALWLHDELASAWPLWAESQEIAVASTSAPAGWQRLVGELRPAEAPIPLGRALARDPERLGQLPPPLLIGVRDGASGRLIIVNDCVGAARLYEMRIEDGDVFGSGGWVWSNRLGALPLFAGIAPSADDDAWKLFAAAGWFIGDSTPIRGARKVCPGSIIEARGGDGGPRVERRKSGAIRALVAPRNAPFDGAVAAAAEDAIALARDAASLSEDALAIDLSGGRDSRVSAAAVIAAGAEARFRTGDRIPGEVQIVDRLLEAAGRALSHRTSRAEKGEPPDDLRERIRAIHLIHDGMRNPQELRRPMQLPLPIRRRRVTLSGHGGEIGHAVYYKSEKKLRAIEADGEKGLLERLERAGKRSAPAARRGAYVLYRRELERVLDEGRALGLRGPTLLDYFYLTQRFAHRSGIASRSGRYSCCATPGFIRAAFDLTPEERVAARLHAELSAQLIPAWRDIPYFKSEDSGPLPEVRRQRIWEKPRHAEAVEEIIETGGAWEEIFKPRAVRKMWRRARKGKGHQHYEGVFNRVVWREGFEEHLAELGPGS